MIFDKIGEMALGSRLRVLSETITKDAKRIYELYNNKLKPKWFPVFYYLSERQKERSITEIANAINHTHPSVIKIVKEMSASGLVLQKKDKTDKRKNNIVLTQKGKDLSVQIQEQYRDVSIAIKKTLLQSNHNLWIAIQEFEYLLEQKSIYERVLEQKKVRLSRDIKIVSYHIKYKDDFKKLNEEWITKYFKMEDTDRKSLEHPEECIINKGGEILIAIEKGKVLGVCALLKMRNTPYDYELAKMAVAPEAQGKGIGSLLGFAILEKAKMLGAKTIYLESNTLLKPAIALYEKLGFIKISGHPSPYERCNIQMELKLI